MDDRRALLNALSDQISEHYEANYPDGEEWDHPLAGDDRLDIHVSVIASGCLFSSYNTIKLRLPSEPETTGPLVDVVYKMIRLSLIRVRWEVSLAVEDSLMCCQLDRLIDLLANLDQLRQEVEVWKRASQPES
jgi:hypothetical protein